MKILITQRELMQMAGSELVTVEVGRALRARGHEVAIFCPRPGNLVKLLQPSGISVKSALRDLPWTPDVIHGHHHLAAMAALAHFEKTPAIYCWHGVRPWVEQPPAHQRIRRYVAICEPMVPQLQLELDLPADRIAVIPNFVDTRRFSRIRALPAMPKKALLYGHGGFSPEELQRLEQLCATFGLSFEKIGYPYNNANPAPESFLPDYDIVFAIGRCAIEAIACGCAVIPIVHALAGSLVTEATLADWANTNFSPRHFTSGNQIEEHWFAAQLDAYAPAGLARVTETVRTRHSLEQAVDRLEALYREVTATPAEDGGGGFAPYLERLSLQADENWKDLDRLRDVERREAALRTAFEDSQRRLQQSEQDRAHLRRNIDAANIQIKAFDRLLRKLIGSSIALAGAVPPTPEAIAEAIAAELRSCGVFDMSWYMSAYPDVAAAGLDPVTHYILHGIAERRSLSPIVDALGPQTYGNDPRPDSTPEPDMQAGSGAWSDIRSD